MVSSRSTKAEILAAYVTLRDQPTTAADVVAWLQSSAQVIAKEASALVKDCYNLGRSTRRWYDQVVAELSQPLIKP